MSPSANGLKLGAQNKVYIVQRRAEFRGLNSRIDPNTDQQPYEPEISYLDFAYLDNMQAHAVAIREQILELDESGTHNGRKVAAQTVLSLKQRLKVIHKELDAAPGAHEDPEASVVKFEVLEFPVAPLQPFNEAQFLKDLDNQSDSEDIEDEEGDEEEADDEEGDEEADEGEEGVDEIEGEEEEDEEGGEDDLEELDDDDEGEEVDDDEDDDSDTSPRAKKQRT
uniref:Uncharacterized protein n=1 Tax=Physcomitrium patens TaxID=3218 RepID=A9T356_PHYPA|nr:hypothetical protein PHYPA_017360 [Physcomitrium patens]